MLHVDRTGIGPVIVLTHGLGDDGRTWDAMVPLLAGTHTVVRWDLRGHARSVATADTEYSREAAIGDLLGIVDAAGEPVHLIGHSLGGYLSLALALRHPERVASLTMIASGPGYRDPAARADWNRYVDEAAARMPIPAAAAGLCHQEDSSVIDGVGGLVPGLLQLVGARDRRFHAGVAYLAERVRGSEVVRIEGAGHHPQRTHPEAVARAVARHVDGTVPYGR